MTYRAMNNCPMCSAFMIGNQCVNCGYRKQEMKYRQMANCPMCSAFMIGNQCVNCGYRKNG